MFLIFSKKGTLGSVSKSIWIIKEENNWWVVVDHHWKSLVEGIDDLYKDYTNIFVEFYPDAADDIYTNILESNIDKLEITEFLDSDHAHDKITCIKITVLMIMTGRTSVFYTRKRQGEIETSAKSGGFWPMKTALEEFHSVIYMLHFKRVKAKYDSFLCDDNRGVIHSSTISDILLKKKHVAITHNRTSYA